MATEIELVAWHEAGHAILAHLLYGPASIRYIGRGDRGTGNGAGGFWIPKSEAVKLLLSIPVTMAGTIAESYVSNNVYELWQAAKLDFKAINERLIEVAHSKIKHDLPALYCCDLEMYVYNIAAEVTATFSTPTVFSALQALAELITERFSSGGVRVTGKTAHRLISGFVTEKDARAIARRFKPAYIASYKEQCRRKALGLSLTLKRLFEVVNEATEEHKQSMPTV